MNIILYHKTKNRLLCTKQERQERIDYFMKDVNKAEERVDKKKAKILNEEVPVNDTLSMYEMFGQLSRIQAVKAKGKKEQLIKTYSRSPLFLQTITYLLNPLIYISVTPKDIRYKMNRAEISEEDKQGSMMRYQDLSFSELLSFFSECDVDPSVQAPMIQRAVCHYPEIYRNMFKAIVCKQYYLNFTGEMLNRAVGYHAVPVLEQMQARPIYERPFLYKTWNSFSVMPKPQGDIFFTIIDYRGVAAYDTRGHPQRLEKIEEALLQTDINNVLFEGIVANGIYTIYNVFLLDDFVYGTYTLTFEQRHQLIVELIGGLEPQVSCLRYLPVYYSGNDVNELVSIARQSGCPLWVIDNQSTHENGNHQNVKVIEIPNEQIVSMTIVGMTEGTGIQKRQAASVSLNYQADATIQDCECSDGFTSNERLALWNKPEQFIGQQAYVLIDKPWIPPSSKNRRKPPQPPTPHNPVWFGMVSTTD